jgi:hypothetical protein
MSAFLVLARARRSERRGQGSGGARPRSGCWDLNADAFGARCSDKERSKRVWLLSFLDVVAVSVFIAGLPAWGRRKGGCRVIPSPRVRGMKRFAGMVGRGQSEGAASPCSGVMSWTTRADRGKCAHVARGERCRARTW